ncbi:hypothetical protein SYNTR_0274 [Candidatus Syntrophocurvum alkaliphilum]|uniref:Stage 0 sporulation protein A homolog n=1 Tax=Candidatus Syntrophocurvum alkaliphilum TaxID=2293317 RepID=A0A6I6D8L2_9FIRM|nr:LytTR family DNA-binding domain-containing protein [Candidatus Syntrophocurvum alkaliphilum]QGT98867.1 hypothetical protein SYNTR_0274 [Candidatus Syntrophocurvum alkaliphilum]
MSVKVIIVDNDQKERIVLRYVLEQIKDVEITDEAITGLEALLLCQKKKVDLVLLDIAMPEMDGLETAKNLNALKDPPLFVFVTVNRDYAVDAYEIGAIDYIIKPIDQVRMEKTVDRVKSKIAHKDVVDEVVRKKLKEKIDFMLERYKNHEIYSNKLPIREKGKISLLSQDSIVYCESQSKKVYIYCSDGEGFLSNFTLSELEQRLDNSYFFRAHQAFLVNLNYVKEIINFGEGSYLLNLGMSNKTIILSRSRAKILRKKLGIQ